MILNSARLFGATRRSIKGVQICTPFSNLDLAQAVAPSLVPTAHRLVEIAPRLSANTIVRAPHRDQLL
jgi:hypothetical protein